MKTITAIDAYVSKLKETIDKLDRDKISALAEALHDACINDRHIYIFGNGGSAATASHFLCDINKDASNGREKRFRTVCLNDNIPVMMAFANDVHYDSVFVEQLKNYLKPGDVVIAISGSGNSKNIIKAVEYAKTKGHLVGGITGYDGGELGRLADIHINAKVNDMQISEDIHMIVVHLLAKCIKEKYKNACDNR